VVWEEYVESDSSGIDDARARRVSGHLLVGDEEMALIRSYLQSGLLPLRLLRMWWGSKSSAGSANPEVPLSVEVQDRVLDLLQDSRAIARIGQDLVFCPLILGTTRMGKLPAPVLQLDPSHDPEFAVCRWKYVAGCAEGAAGGIMA